jgi:hypothetical protein
MRRIKKIKKYIFQSKYDLNNKKKFQSSKQNKLIFCFFLLLHKIIIRICFYHIRFTHQEINIFSKKKKKKIK